jgi:ROS/MUCR transcriptional regulator protein
VDNIASVLSDDGGHTKVCAGCSSHFVVTLPRQRICSSCKASRPANASRRWRQENPNKVRAQKRRWYRRHREKLKAKARLHYQINHDRIRGSLKEQRKTEWRRVTPEELKLLQKDLRQARPKKETTFLSTRVSRDDIVCLECAAILQTLTRHLGPIHGITATEYKRKWGYNNRTPLTSHSLSSAASNQIKRRGLSVQFKASRRPFTQPPAHPPKMPLEYKLDCRDKAKGKQRPELWKKSLDGKIASDIQIAKLHLQGFTRTEIAAQVGLKFGESVSARLQRMGYPNGHACLYLHGDRVTGLTVLNCCEDLQISRERMAEKMRVSTRWIYQRTSPTRRDSPLPPQLARAFISGKESLRGEYGHQVTTPKGGRPPAVLPSERKALSSQYQELRTDLWKLRGWLREQYGRLLLSDIWAWMCQQSRQRNLKTLFRWPQFFDWLSDSSSFGSFSDGTWRPNELAIGFLSDDYHVAFDTLRRIVRTT